MPHPSIDQPGAVESSSGQPTLSLPSTTYNISNITGGTINNVQGDFNTNIRHQVNHNHHNHHYGISPAALSNPGSESSPSLPPFNDAPIDRISSCFTGREPELEFITTSFDTFQSDKPTRFVIYGMPGLGKSQLALQHANLAFIAGVYSHVCCISASTVEKLSRGLTRILDLFNHPDRNHPDQAVQLASVRLLLEQSNRHGCRRWLLIFDNVTMESAHFLREHLPRQNSSGSILITTRTCNIAESVANVAGQEHLTFELKALSKADSVNLLLRKAGIQTSTLKDLVSAEQLVGRVGCLPLAVEQAGSFMKRSGFKDASQLQRLYDESGLTEVIRWENNLTTYEATSILSTFTVQLQTLGDIDPDAHKLLKTLAFFDPENIPIDILVLGARSIRDGPAKSGGASLEASPAPEREPKERVRTALRHFEDLSIAQPLHDGQPSLHIHDLIQWVLQQSTLVRQEEGYRALAVALLCHAFRTIDHPDEPQSWAECERFVPHFTSLGAQEKTHPTISEEYVVANHWIAEYFAGRGRYGEAEILLTRVLAHRKRLLGSNDIRTFKVMHSLARVDEKLGRYQEAEALFVQLLAANEKHLGVDHPETLTTVNNLAQLYKTQERLNEAESLYGRALAGQEKQLGADHPATLTTVNNVARLYVTQGKFDEAEGLYGRALTGKEKHLGADHPSTLTTVNNFAELYRTQGRLDEAESLYGRALAGRERHLGADHPDTLLSVNNLANLYEAQGRITEAESLYGRALAGAEKQLGADHPDTLAIVNNVARLYVIQGKFDEAEGLYGRALAGREQHFGADHPKTLRTVALTANLRNQQGQYHEAEALYRRALVALEAKLGPDHPDTQRTRERLAWTLEAQGRWEEAHVQRAARAEELEWIVVHDT
ncbi:TPR-like protein [Athelia psychrophila]|uniref:TPR-like protein n=1 Tax=Athelia psychrophila TaxID=1759441 RepID=A0A166P8C1_9AGAM|nr:TPR-like protein [Fibularhizoctonia sp. CBS 109695]